MSVRSWSNFSFCSSVKEKTAIDPYLANYKTALIRFSDPPKFDRYEMLL